MDLCSFVSELQCLLRSITVMSTSKREMDNVFMANFTLFVLGSLLTTGNAKLVGVKHSIFYYLCVLGYSMAPFLIPALLNLILGKHLPRLFLLLASLFALIWAIKSVDVFFTLTLDPKKRFLVLYPVFLFYLFFAWFSILS